MLSLLADAPYEKYYVTYSPELRRILQETIGILTINSGVKKGKEIKTYFREGENFNTNKVLNAKETNPLSNYGFHPPVNDSLISNYRYPLIASDEDFLCIVYDVKNGLKTWVNKKELEKDFYVSIVMIDSLPIPNRFLVNIFYFTYSGNRKLYDQPNRESKFRIISKGKRYNLLKIIEQEEEFVKLGVVRYNYETSEEEIEPIGWVRTRDNEGMLMFWIRNFDFY